MKNRRFTVVMALVGLFSAFGQASAADDPVFSGPQVGERLAELKVKGVFDAEAGKEFDYAKQAGGKAVFLIFVHELTRPSVRVTKTLMDYAATRKTDGLFSAVVFLGDDATETAARLKRARHALPQKTPIGISVDGQEGPGAYGLNRKVTLTVLAAKDDRVTANFALIQPSEQADVPKIVKAIVDIVGGKVPALKDLVGERYMRRPKNAKKGGDRGSNDARLLGLLRRVINKQATPEDVERTAAELEKYIADRPKLQQDIGRRAGIIVNGGKLENYGTKKAQEFIRKWAEKYKPSNKDGDKPSSKDGDAKKRKPEQKGR